MMFSDLKFILLTTFYITRLAVICHDNEGEPYLGKYLGPFNTFSHQIEGELYAINRSALLLKNFYYDGSGRDTYFWTGSSNHQSRRTGFPIPDEERRTNVLKKYIGADLTLILPEKKVVSELRWFAIYDIATSTVFAEVEFPEDFEVPGSHRLPEFTRNDHDVQSNPILVSDSKTLSVTSLTYDGLGPDTYFWVGSGPIPSSKGKKIPDENGYLEPLRPYKNANISLLLPGNMTIFDIDWLSIYNVATKANYGSMLFPNELNVPPSLVKSLTYSSNYANCEQLHKRLQISWEIFDQNKGMHVELAGQIRDDDYIAFGINDVASKMIDSRVIILNINGTQAQAEEYSITDKTPCLPVPVDGKTILKGVCPHRITKGGGQINVYKTLRFDGVSVINFTFPIRPGGVLDPNLLGSYVHIVWAIGPMNSRNEPVYHYLRNTGSVKLNFGRQPTRNCFSFTVGDDRQQKTWAPLMIANPHLTVFNFTLGPSAGQKGYEGITGLPPPGLVWYVNGILAPEIYVKRGQKYLLSIEGGDNVQEPFYHHPFYITDDMHGGYQSQTPEERRMVNIYAGITHDHKGRPIPSAAGRLCLWENPALTPRNWDEFVTFSRFRRTLKMKCKDGQPYVLEWTPNSTIPNVVYYQSFRQSHMGWKIHVVDLVRQSKGIPLMQSNIHVQTVIVALLITTWINYHTFLS